MSSKKSPQRPRLTTRTPPTVTKTSREKQPSRSADSLPPGNARPRPPEPGAIVDYGYLWKREHDAGQENASKVRPCYILGVKQIDGLYIVSVLPISSSATGARVPIHPRERAALGLPDDCDVVIEEANVSQWPGPDIVPQDNRALMRANPASRKLTSAIADARAGRKLEIVFRTV